MQSGIRSRASLCRLALRVLGMFALFVSVPALAACVPGTAYTVTTTAPPPNASWTDTSGALWTPAGGFPGCQPGDSVSSSNVSPTTITINSAIPNPIVGLTFNAPGSVVQIDTGGVLMLAGQGSLAGGAKLLLNGGTLDIQNGGSLSSDNSNFQMNTTGTLDVDSGGQWTIASGATITILSGSAVNVSGDLRLDGTLDNQGTVTFSGATVTGSSPLDNENVLTGSAELNVDVTNSGRIAPGGDNGIGALNNLTSFTQSSSGILAIELADASNYDQMTVTGAVTLDGQLQISFIAPSFGSQWAPLTFASRSGDFATKQLPTSPKFVSASYTPTELDLSAAPVTHLSVTAPATTTAGTPFTFTVAAEDDFGNAIADYSGTVHFTSSDANPNITLPTDYTFTAAYGGMHTFANGATLLTAGNRTITATDTATSIGGTSGTITVSPAAAAQFLVNAPASATAGTAFNFTITAQDLYGNTVPSYTGTVHFSSMDALASLPADYPFVAGDAGVHTFTSGATLKTGGSQTITAADKLDSSITGSAAIAVTATTTTEINSVVPTGPITLGSFVTVNVAVSSQFAGAPSGTITVTDSPDGDHCTIILPSNSCMLTPGSVGLKTISASYAGDSYFGASNSSNSASVSVTPPSHLVTATSTGNGGVSPASQYIADGNTAYITLTPSPGYAATSFGGSCPAGMLSGNIYTIANIVADCDVSVSFAQATLTLSITDHQAFARYGIDVTYDVTLSNPSGTDVSGVSISGTAPSGLDLADGQWQCLGSHCTPSASGPFTDSGVTIPASSSVTWLVTIPVLANAPGATIDYTVSVSGAGTVAPQTDSDTLVTFHDGFDVPYADGAQ